MFGRNGESPLPVLAPSSPSDCFDIALEAVKLAIRGMTPVIILSEGFLANSSEPWLIPDPDSIPEIEVKHPEARPGDNGQEPFLPFERDPETLARPWALPGTAGLEHRMGGLSKAPLTGKVSYDPADHEQMVMERAEKVARLADIIPEQDVFGPESGELLVLSFGGTFGAARSAVAQVQGQGKSVSHANLRYLNPFPKNLAQVMDNFEQILVPELNGGQLAFLLQGQFARPVISYPKLHARPFRINEIVARLEELLD
jgi:2-oxoglutarate ferredoxin oxidoreductase subunit alpha